MPIKCLLIDVAGFITTTTDHGRLHSLQIDGQVHSPGLPSLREAITTTYGVAVWLLQLPGFPSARPADDVVDDRPAQGASSGENSEEVTYLTLRDEQDEDGEVSDEELGIPDMQAKGWIGLRTVRLNDGSHRVIRLTRGSPSATSGDIQIGEDLTYVDDIEVSNLPTESIEILLSGPSDSNVRLHLISLGGVDRDVFLARIAWDKPSISWSRAVLPLRIRRRELERPKKNLNGPVAPVRSESEELELLQLQQGEAVFLKVRKILMKNNFPTFDSISRVHATVNATRFYTSKVKAITAKSEAALNIWLSWLSRNSKLVANLELPKARVSALPSAQHGGMTRKQRERSMAKILAESTRLTSVVSSHPLPIIKDFSFLAVLRATQRGNQELRDTCIIDGIPLEEDVVTAKIGSMPSPKLPK